MFPKALSLVLLTLLSSALSAQTTTPKGKPKQNSVAEPERQRLRQQAFETVNAVWTNSGDIADIRQRSEINSRAFRLVWTIDPELALTELIKNFDELLAVYPSTNKEDQSRNTIETAIGDLIAVLALSDSATAQKLQQRYFDTRRQITGVTDDRRDLADKLKLASELLDTDATQSVRLATRVFERVVPESAIQYLFNLQRREPRMAQQLFQSMLRLLASGRHYSPGSAIAISVFAFNENQSVSPGVWKGDDGKLNLALVASATSYERSRDNVDMTFAKDFVSAAYQYLQARVLEGSGVDRSDLPALYTNYFLEQKVKAYSQRYRLDPEAQWLRYETAIIALARQAGGTERDFTLLAEAAQMISSPQSSPSDMEESALARAAEEKDPRKKTGLLVRGILYLLREKRFSAAEQSAELLEDVNIRNQMIQVVRVAALKDAIETRRWNEVSQKLDKIDDRTMKLYLLLEAGRVIGSSKPDREVALRYLSDARKLLGSLDNALQKAAGAVAALALTQRTDPAFGQIALNDLSTIINGAEKYQGQNYFAVLRLPANNSEFGYKLKEIGFEECFAHAGRQDWIGADLAARNLENKYLRAWARLAAAKALLEKKDSPSVTEMSH